MYIGILTRPDITYSLGQLSQHLSNPGPEHWTAAKQVMAYLKGTHNYGLCFDGN